MPDTALLAQASATKTAERLARIEANQTGMRDDMAELHAYLARVLDSHDTRLRQVEVKQARSCADTANLRGDVTALKTRSVVWDSINSLAAVVAGVWGATK